MGTERKPAQLVREQENKNNYTSSWVAVKEGLLLGQGIDGTLAAHTGHEFNYHYAQSDAEAAGRVLLAMMTEAKALTVAVLVEKTDGGYISVSAEHEGMNEAVINDFGLRQRSTNY